jgi:hypothetical protein
METTNQTIPTLSAVTAATLAAFKEDEAFSFVRPYNAAAVGIEGYRHSVIRWRVTGTNKVEKPAKMVTIPAVTLPDDWAMSDEAKAVLIAAIEDQQDALIRDAIEAKKDIVDWSDVDLTSALAALTATRISSRLTKEGIENWFMVAGNVVRQYCEARGTEIADKKSLEGDERKKQIAGTSNAYKAGFAKLAAAVPNLPMEDATRLLNMLTLSEAADDMAKALGKKLNQILNPPAANNGDL